MLLATPPPKKLIHKIGGKTVEDIIKNTQVISLSGTVNITCLYLKQLIRENCFNLPKC